MKESDTILIGVDFSHGESVGVLIVGRKLPNEGIDIINQFEGQEARDLYEKLTGGK